VDLSQESITGHQFDLNRRGYDPDSVDAHLREIAAAVSVRDAEFAAKTAEIEELRRSSAELQSKVQDASESEEALRLTLKAAAHAKEELLANAREQAALMEQEASERAQQMVVEAEAHAKSLTDGAEARASAMTEGAIQRAREVARAALSESELLVVRIEQLRTQVDGAEESLRALSSEAGSRLVEARQGLDQALEAARASAENPELLAAAIPESLPTANVASQDLHALQPEVAPHDQPIEAGVAPQSEFEQGADVANVDSQPELEQATDEVPVAHHEESFPAAVSHSSDEAPQPSEPGATPEVETPRDWPPEPAPEAETVSEQSSESSADISNKVDRLLEELREVT
jgi:DivIVA domain-containing protein